MTLVSSSRVRKDVSQWWGWCHSLPFMDSSSLRPFFVFILGCVVGVFLTRLSMFSSVLDGSRGDNSAPFERVPVNAGYHRRIVSIIHGDGRRVNPEGMRRSKAFTAEELFHVLLCERFDWDTFLEEGSGVYRQMLAPYRRLFTRSHGLTHGDVVSMMDSFHNVLKEERVVETWEYCVGFRRKDPSSGERRRMVQSKKNIARNMVQSKKNIAIVMVGIGYESNDNAQASIENKKMYATRHGYAMYVLEEVSGSRHPAWYKFSSALQRLSDHDFVWVVDVDTIITNMDQPLEDIINPAFDMIVGVDPNGSANTGSVIIKSTDWSKLFLMYLWSIDSGERSDVVWDQSAFEHAISSRFLSANPHRGDESLRLGSHIMFVGQDVFNSDNIQLLDHIPFVLNFHAKAAGLGQMRALADVVSATFE